MSYRETETEDGYGVVQIACDEHHCLNRAYLMMPISLDACRKLIFAMGWRLKGDHQVCPAHSAPGLIRWKPRPLPDFGPLMDPDASDAKAQLQARNQTLERALNVLEKMTRGVVACAANGVLIKEIIDAALAHPGQEVKP